jgi:hypothetical protein
VDVVTGVEVVTEPEDGTDTDGLSELVAVAVPVEFLAVTTDASVWLTSAA